MTAQMIAETTQTLSPQNMFALITAPIETAQAIELKELFNILRDESANPQNRGRACRRAAHIFLKAHRPIRATDAEYDEYYQWQLKSRRDLISEFTAQAERYEDRSN